LVLEILNLLPQRLSLHTRFPKGVRQFSLFVHGVAKLPNGIEGILDEESD
jgi:hypothetical protein